MIFIFKIMGDEERRLKMGSAKKFLIAASIMVVISWVAPSTAICQGLDDCNWPVQATFYSPVQIGSMVLSPGTYNFQLTDGTLSRNVVEVYSVDQKRWLGMVMGINDSRRDTSKMTGFTFENIGKDNPVALQYWYYPNWSRGIKFIYPNAEAATMTAAIRPSR
jgi:hypothetical protein